MHYIKVTDSFGNLKTAMNKHETRDTEHCSERERESPQAACSAVSACRPKLCARSEGNFSHEKKTLLLKKKSVEV